MRNSQLIHEMIVSESYTKDMEEQQIKRRKAVNKNNWEESTMNKFGKKVTAIIGSVTLAVGLMALPALAETSQQNGIGWFGQMQGYMQKNFSPRQHQAFMNSTEMQNFHNSQGMQDAMQTGDVKKMQELMNSNPAVKAHMGQDNLDKMNEFMINSGGSMMTNGGMTGSQGSMMNGSGSATGKKGNNMMGAGVSMHSQSNH